MRLSQLAAIVACGTVLIAGSAIVAAPAQNRPGEMSEARVWVQNRSAAEAIPVAVANAPRVELAGTPRVSFAPGAAVTARAAQQPWDYRAASVPAGGDVAAALTALGVDGWEAVGLTSADGRIVILLKRPRQ